ncbi:thioredoxin [Ectothiorhodospira haloalkaliphila]|uniref:thioredoxin n=1 Tax=Ectothiorhodospira haloalkaliphila TaxID=421628 RepID=UPI001EE791B2|nr:thioredoxin [Ectothiorhodospira haloalkaliphila]MCG5524103.1 thioredoxin [Ectothiorhodospira haloalkaliphila]
MSTSDHIVDITQENFHALVIEGSQQRPVLVDFWADWCQPCQMLMPILAKLAEEYAGGFLLAKVNSDQQQDLALQYGVRSLPTVLVFRDGEPVDQFMGVQPESTIRQMLDKHLPGPGSESRRAAREALEAGHAETALAHLEVARQANPEDEELKIDQAQALLMLGRVDEAEAVMKTVPVHLHQEDAGRRVDAQLRLARARGDLAAIPAMEERLDGNPDDPEALHRVGAARILAGEHEAGLAMLMQLMKKHRTYGEDAGHKGLLAAFELLGARHPLLNDYRRKMMALMF